MTMSHEDTSKKQGLNLRERGKKIGHFVSPELLKKHSPVPHYQRALRTVRVAPWLLVWKIGWDFLYRVVALSALGFVVVLIVEHFERSMVAYGDLSIWADELATILTSPTFITGSVGLLGIGALLAMSCDAFIRGGIWGTLARATDKTADVSLRTFFYQGTRRFTAMIGFKLLSYLTWLFLAMMGLTLAVSLWRVSTMGAFRDVGPWGMGAMWGLAGAV
jgi:hypothetical protein